jgi:hypothetical protein
VYFMLLSMAVVLFNVSIETTKKRNGRARSGEKGIEGI